MTQLIKIVFVNLILTITDTNLILLDKEEIITSNNLVINEEEDLQEMNFSTGTTKLSILTLYQYILAYEDISIISILQINQSLYKS